MRDDPIAKWAPAAFVLLWSTGFIGAKFGLPYSEPITFLWIRFAVVTVLLAAVVLVTRPSFPRRPMVWLHIVVTGFLLHSLYLGGVFTAIDAGVDSGIAALIVGVQPLLVALLVGPLLGESLNRRQWAGFVLGLGGLVLVLFRTFEVGRLPLDGLVANLIALLALVAGQLYQKRFVPAVDIRSGTLIQFAAALGFSFVHAQAFETGQVVWHPEFIFALAWLCVVLSLGAMSLLWYLIRHGAASRTASLFYLVPVGTAIMGYLFFDEVLTPAQILGIVLTVIGVAIINRNAPGARAA
ncbi:MAG TPA: DMT family transporter [Arenicellales bacterium]|nr:DMT family transporter [Arenicellales bacterium]